MRDRGFWAGLMWAGVAAVVMTGPARVLGQGPGRIPAPPNAAPGYHAFEGPVLSVEFPGGPLSRYVEALRDAVPGQPVNITLQKRTADVMVPPISLRDVTLQTALAAVQRVAEPGDGKQLEISPVAMFSGVASSASPAFSVSLVPERQVGQFVQSSPPQAARQTRSLSLRELIDGGKERGGMDAEVILSAVDGVLQLEDKEAGEPPQVKFHKDSGLLLIRGTQEQIRAVEEAVERLSASVRHERANSGAERAAEAKRKLDMERAKINLERFEASLSFAIKELSRVEEQVRAGQESTAILEQAQFRVVTAQQDLRIAKAEFEAASAGYTGPSGDRPAEDGDRLKKLEAENADLRSQLDALRKLVEDNQKRGEKPAPKR